MKTAPLVTIIVVTLLLWIAAIRVFSFVILATGR